jgi:hypothetical protein
VARGVLRVIVGAGKPNEFTERRLQQAICEMTPIAEQVLLDPALAVEAPWNDLLGRGG